MTTRAPALVWFFQDLRLDDQPALAAALASGRPIVPVFVFDPVSPAAWAPGGAARWWLEGSLAEETGATEIHGGRAVEPWRDDTDARLAWRRGETGIPIVDAGMRQLWRWGWMHNRVRMIAASFLVKHLLLPWRAGEAWFWDTLLDADLTANAASWQWVAGSGADAAPYFRIFTPILQGAKFDPNGAYVRRFVPELAALPDEFIHAPWMAPRLVLSAAGVEIGKTYPRPIVDLALGRARALAAFAALPRRAA